MNGGNPGNHILEHLGKAWPPLEDFMKRIHVTKEGYHGGTYEGKATVLSPITNLHLLNTGTVFTPESL